MEVQMVENEGLPAFAEITLKDYPGIEGLFLNASVTVLFTEDLEKICQRAKLVF